MSRRGSITPHTYATINRPRLPLLGEWLYDLGTGKMGGREFQFHPADPASPQQTEHHMDISALLDRFSTGEFSALVGLVVGLTFGVFAQQSRFCLRAACVEFWRGQTGQKFAIWLLAFGAAMAGTQYFIEAGMLDTGQIRQLNNTER